MKISRFGIAMIKKFEGFSSTPYKCPAGLQTIGYGHVIQKGEALLHLTEKQAESLLLRDINMYETALSSLGIRFSQNQFDALLSLSFNLGLRNFLNSTLCKYLKLGDFIAASKEFTRWVYSAGRVLPGLQRRREIEKNLFMT
ncbi:MAG: lysozyme [Rickettsiales bacterium]